MNIEQPFKILLLCLLCSVASGCNELGQCPADEKHLERHDPAFISADTFWGSWGKDANNSHYVPDETRINANNVNQLEVKWTSPTTGSVSATPTVAGDTLYFPDWGPLVDLSWPGGMLSAVNRWTGKAVWSRRVDSYNDNQFNNISRSSPAISGDLIVVGDIQNQVPMVTFPAWALRKVRALLGLDDACGGFLYAINRFTGDLVWKTRIGAQEYDSISQSPVVHNGKVYVGVSSNESAYVKDKSVPCCKFRGNVVAVNLHTGNIEWRQYMTYDNQGALDQFSGASVWGGAPTIDAKRNSLYVPTGNNYHVPAAYQDCVKNAQGDQTAIQLCAQPWHDNYFDSIVALDLDSGAIKWVARSRPFDAWVAACRLDVGFALLGGQTFNCPDPAGLDADFAQPPMLYTVEINGEKVDRLAAGTKAGVFFSFNPDNGEIVWQHQVGPGGAIGGMEFGAATDARYIYVQNSNFEHTPYVLEAGSHKGEQIVSGFWTALDAVTGNIVWQTPVPGYNLPLTGIILHPAWGAGKGKGYFKWPMGPPTVANNIVYAGVSDLEGTMVAMNADTGEILWQYQSHASIVSAPSIVDGRLYWGVGYKYGNEGHMLYSFGLPDDRR